MLDGWGERRRQGWPRRGDGWTAELDYPDVCRSFVIDSDECPDPESNGSSYGSQEREIPDSYDVQCLARQ